MLPLLRNSIKLDLCIFQAAHNIPIPLMWLWIWLRELLLENSTSYSLSITVSDGVFLQTFLRTNQAGRAGGCFTWQGRVLEAQVNSLCWWSPPCSMDRLQMTLADLALSVWLMVIGLDLLHLGWLPLLLLRSHYRSLRCIIRGSYKYMFFTWIWQPASCSTKVGKQQPPVPTAGTAVSPRRIVLSTSIFILYLLLFPITPLS